MPTRKQRRRRQKLQRHEYEEVYIDPTTGSRVTLEVRTLLGQDLPLCQKALSEFAPATR